MSCYFRHMKDIFEAAGVELTRENKKAVDRIVHQLVAVEYKSCSRAWKAVKAGIQRDEKSKNRFVERLKMAMAGNKKSL